MQITTAGFRLLTAIAALAVAPAVSAAPVTFAQFVMDVATNSFVWDNQGNGTSTFTSTSQVDFKFDNVAIHPALQGFQDATLTMTASTTSAAGVINPIAIQGGISGSIIITRNTAFMGENLLLRVDFTDGNMFAQLGGSSAQFGRSTPPSEAVTFSSDFLTFGNTTSRDFSLSLSSVFPLLAVGTNGQLRDFTAAATGTFSAEPQPIGEVPEPATMALLGGGLLGIGLARFRRR